MPGALELRTASPGKRVFFVNSRGRVRAVRFQTLMARRSRSLIEMRQPMAGITLARSQRCTRRPLQYA
jgi:hypothetical protein